MKSDLAKRGICLIAGLYALLPVAAQTTPTTELPVRRDSAAWISPTRPQQASHLTLDEAIYAAQTQSIARHGGKVYLPFILLVLPLLPRQPAAVAEPDGRSAEFRSLAAAVAGLRHGGDALHGELQSPEHARTVDQAKYRVDGRYAAALLVAQPGSTSSRRRIRNPTILSRSRSPTPNRSSPTINSNGTRRSPPRSTNWPNARTSKRWRTSRYRR